MDRPVQEAALLDQQNASLQQQLEHQNAALQQQIIRLEQEKKDLSGSLQHIRAWAASLTRFPQTRYHPDLLKPPRRIYVGSLPSDTKDVGHISSCTSADNNVHATCEQQHSIVIGQG